MQAQQAASIVVIGAGIAGLTCARMLAEAGASVLVLDKGRGIGGRMATRRAMVGDTEISFDHGAQTLPARIPGFRDLLLAAQAEAWPQTSENADLVGVPGMSALPRALATGLAVQQSVEVKALNRVSDGWSVGTSEATFLANRVIVAIPAPQAARLLTATDLFQDELTQVRMAPCLALMAAFPTGSARPFTHRADTDHPLVWIAQDSSKPGRSDAATTWVAQAGPEFSTQYLEHAKETLPALLLPLLCDVIGEPADRALHVAAHRWRYAQTAQPLGKPFLQSADSSLLVGGDWCLGARAEHGWASGTAMAQHVLKDADVG